MPKVRIVPVGKIEPALLEYLAMTLPDGVGGPCTVAGRPIDAREAFDPRRRQYHSTRILSLLASAPSAAEPGTRTLGVADVDLFIPILTFVFGEAQLGGSAAVISAARLRQEFYGLPGDGTLFYERCAKEGMHEIGHTLGLVHCPSYDCVMHYSNSIEDVDLKRPVWCRECAVKQTA